MKTCSVCLTPKRLDEFYPGKGYRLGVMSRCKVCHNAMVKARRPKRARVYRNYGTDKACSKCGVSKPLTAFYVDRRTRSGRQSECRQCHMHAPGYDEARRESIRTMRRRFSHLTNAARRDGWRCDLTLEEYTALITRPCDYCDGPLGETGKGLDRKDSRRGYTKDNVTPCCGPCNRAKFDTFTYEEMKREIGPAIARVMERRRA